jgi:ribosomal protein S18 acetylase RimI-like enzyme
MIRRAKLQEIPDILRITKACAADMANCGIYQWNEHYPSREIIEKDLERDELYVLAKPYGIIGLIVISEFMDPEYREVRWLTANSNNRYIHRLAVHPEFQGKGHARQLMLFAETMAKKAGVVSIRLDTFSQNQKNQRFYLQRGYKKLGDIYFPLQSKQPFHCYELVL